MRLVTLILIAWVEYWLVMQAPGGEDAPFAWTAAVALVGGVIFALVTWSFLRSRHRESQSVWHMPTFVMVGGLALLGFGGAYGTARESGLDSNSANLDALIGWPGAFLIVAIVGAIFVQKLKSRNRPDA
jgi:hypothetical protein